MSGKNDRKIRKEVKYEEIKKMSFGKRFIFALMIIFKRLK